MSLVDFIEQDLKMRLLSGKGVPAKLTLAGFSEHYAVSMTPVRLAVERLVEEGIIRKGSNGRLEPNLTHAGGGSTKTDAIPRPLSAEDWNRIMLKEIMLTSLGPDAVYLREEAMAQKYNAGRSVIRQTLSRLATPGLLEHVPRCGWLVTPVHQEKMQAYLQVREALELTALDLALPHMQNEALERMLARNQPRQNGRPRLDNELHRYWIDLSGNFYIQAFFEQHIARYYTMLFDHAAPEISVVADMAGMHRTILEALLARNVRSARKALSEHIWIQEGVLGKFLAQQSE
jgi:DNA-binding GntR family transcriptional regulator